MSIAEMAIVLYAVNNAYFDDVDVARVLPFEAAMLQFVKTKQPALISAILDKKELDAEGEKTLAAVIAEFKKSWA